MDKKSSKSRFFLVKHECGNEQHVFDSVKTEVLCSMCKKVLAKPTGGLSDVYGKAVKVADR